MADKPTGPVKPPTLDLTARKTGPQPDKSEKPASAPDNAQPEPATPDKPATPPKDATSDAPKPRQAPKPRPAPALPVGTLAATGVGGAVLGLAAAYGLAGAGLWPASDALGTLEARIARAENTLEVSARDLGEIESRIGTLETAPVPALPALPDDLVTRADLDARITALGRQIDVLATGAPADESAALAGEIDRLGAGLETLDADLGALAVRIETLEAQAADQASLDALRAERDRFARLPGATAALEAAIASGQPFGAELAAIEALVPELGLSNPVRAIAANGVTPLRETARAFRALIPGLLAARPQDPEAGWLDTLMGQAESVLALRPVDAGARTPEAIVGRIETALDNGDATTARTLLLDLPAPMQAVAAPVRAELDAAIAAGALLADIGALAPQTGEATQ